MTDSELCQTEKIDDGLVVKIDGEIDLVRSPKLRIELLELLKKKYDRVVIDLSGVPYMDSSGVATLVEALQVQRKKSSKLVLCGLQAKVQSIFEIARLDMIFQIVDDKQAAIVV